MFALIVVKNNKEDRVFSITLFMAIIGCMFFLGRFISTQIYERISYYFIYSILLLLPQSMKTLKGKDKSLIMVLILLLSILLFAYRLNGSGFQNFTFFWR